MKRKMLRVVAPAIGAAGVVIAPFVSVPVILPGPAVVSAQGTGGIYLQFSGGPVLGKRVLTNTGASTSTVGWVQMGTVPLSWTVKASESDLFNVTFTADCSFDPKEPDTGFPPVPVNPFQALRIRDTNTGLILHPYETPTFPIFPGGRTFCGTEHTTRTGTWARRFNAGAHNLVAEFFINDGTLRVDEWLFELVVYD